MALGLCCQWMASNPKKQYKYENILRSRSLQLGRFNKGLYSEQRIRQTYLDNLNNLLEVLPLVIDSGIRVFRISSAMFPLFDKVPEDYWHNEQTLALLKLIGKTILDNNLRATTHPGQFVVLSSEKQAVLENSIRELEFHAWLMDQMGLERSPYYSINVHGGKSNLTRLLIDGVKQLNEATRSRLTLENCEFAYSIADLLPVSRATGVPLCFDSHHHTFNTGELSSEDAMSAAMATWPKDVRPLTHLSNSKPEYVKAVPTKARQHSDYLWQVPLHQKEANNQERIDIDIEAKRKNLAIFDAVKKLELKLV